MYLVCLVSLHEESYTQEEIIFLHREWGPIEPFDDSMPNILKSNNIYTHLISDHLHYWEDGGATYHTRYNSWEIVRGQEGDQWKPYLKESNIPEVLRVPKAHDGSGKASSLWYSDWTNRQYTNTKETFPQNQVFQLGCEFLEKHKQEENWFLQIETFDPHEPFFLPKDTNPACPRNYKRPHFDWPRGKVEESPEVIEHVRSLYTSLLDICDQNLGLVLDLFDKHNLWEDTLLIVGTEHGWLLGEHDWWGKNLMPYYDHIAHTPLFIWDPRLKIQNESRDLYVQMTDWAPTVLEYFKCPIPVDMQGKSITTALENQQDIRDSCMYGVFGGHVNITNGKYTYMRAPVNPDGQPLFDYTLMPMHMKKLFTPQELQVAELVPPFPFTKNCPVLKIPVKDTYKQYSFGHLLFDIENDPNQENPISNVEIEKKMIHLLVQSMKDSHSPIEQFDRLGLKEYL